jgi:hypothetical protein
MAVSWVTQVHPVLHTCDNMAKAEAMNLNTVFAPVYWELLEPAIDNDFPC